MRCIRRAGIRTRVPIGHRDCIRPVGRKRSVVSDEMYRAAPIHLFTINYDRVRAPLRRKLQRGDALSTKLILSGKIGEIFDDASYGVDYKQVDLARAD